MPIIMHDQRQHEAAAGTPLAGVTDVAKRNDEVMVQALQPYMEGREHKNAQSAPYAVPRHHAAELAGHGFARILEDEKPGKQKPAGDEEADESADEQDVEQPDDASDASAAGRAPAAAAQGGPLSTVPARPGDQPVTPTAPRRGRPAARRG